MLHDVKTFFKIRVQAQTVCFLVLLCFFLSNCADLGKVFQGNTRQEFGQYDIQTREQYRHHLQYSEEVEQEKEKEILKRLQEDDKRKGKAAEKARYQKRHDSSVRKFLRRLFHFKG